MYKPGIQRETAAIYIWKTILKLIGATFLKYFEDDRTSGYTGCGYQISYFQWNTL